MPNWCNNTSVILSYEKGNKNLKKVYDVIDSIVKDVHDKKCNNRRTYELYARLTDLSEEEILNGAHNCGYIRGFVDAVEFDAEDEVITLFWQSAWGPMIEGLDYILKPYGLYAYTIAEEPGECVYVNTDETGIYFKDRYLFKAYDAKEDLYTREYFGTESEAVTFVREYLGRVRGINNFEEAERAVEKYNDKHENDDSYIVFEEFSLE